MRITKKIISLLLAVIMLCGTMTGLSVITASAADTTSDSTTESSPAPGEEEEVLDYMNEPLASPDEKLATMEKMYSKGNYTIYADERSGEVAVKDNVTGQVMFTNPYDLASSGATANIKSQLLSQIVVTYIDNGKENVFYSYEWAAELGQITVKNIRGGIRVEYTIGREQARRLVPQWIEKSRFETLILPGVQEYYSAVDGGDWWIKKFSDWYSLKSLDNCVTDREKLDMMNTYPCTVIKEGDTYVKGMDIYVFDPTANAVELSKQEEVIKGACPDYSYEDLDYDHQLTGYVSKDENPPVFKMALEYTINEDGFSVRLPANGIRFNQEKYQLENISVLPYMGAGNNNYTGYTFYPDGSGALFAFEDLVDEDTYTVTGRMYGEDYAYHTLKGEMNAGTAYQQDVRSPIFGLKEDTRYYDCIDANGDVTRISGVIYDIINGNSPEGISESFIEAVVEKYSLGEDQTEVVESHGFLAILEEGDALAQLTYSHAGVVAPYDTVKMDFNPRPKDSYNLADSISVGTNSEWTVVSSRKYVGSYRIRYIMLTDTDVAEAQASNQPDTWKWYEADWMGMAEAYRDYLIDQGVLTAMYDGVSDSELEDIPLYIEAFGATTTTEKILSVPVEVQKALTTFEDVKTMYVQLLAKQVTNVNFKLTGFYNGGLYSSMPYNLDWENVVSDEVEFQELLNFAANIEKGDYTEVKAYAKEILSEADAQALEAYLDNAGNKAAIAASLDIFPDFEFTYTNGDEWFDGLSLRKHAVKTIDDRYSSKRMYSATQQKYIGYFQLAISPAYYSHFYEKLMGTYGAYENVTGISVGSLGTDLNSDFDEDEPYNREDSKSFIAKALEYFEEQDLEVMVDGGNAYTWEYIDHMVNAPLDSSRYILASYSIPFIGAVLHGYMDFAGAPLNMEGDVSYATLKAIENGASIYFVLSYRNAQILKEDQLYNQYYSVRYDIWFDDVVEIYNTINADLKDVQNDLIINHEFLSGVRVPDTDELYNDVDTKYQDILNYREELARYEEQMKTEVVANAREEIASMTESASEFIEFCIQQYSGINGAVEIYSVNNDRFQKSLANYMEAEAAYEDISARYAELAAVNNPTDAQKEELEKLNDALTAAEKDKNLKRNKLSNVMTRLNESIQSIQDAYMTLVALYEDALSGKLLIDGQRDQIPASVLAEVERNIELAETLMSEDLGMSFDMSMEKLSMDTVLQAHIANLFVDANGTATSDAMYVVGKAENLYELYADKNYGLKADEVNLLRSLAANRSKTDAELLAEYGLDQLAPGEGSVEALIRFMLELLGDNARFDPLMSEEQIEAHMLAYFEYKLFTEISTQGKVDVQNDVLESSTLLPSLHVVTTKTDKNGNVVEDAAAVALLEVAMTNLTRRINGVTSMVDDGNYRLEDHFTEEDMASVIETFEEDLGKAKYMEGEDLATDVRNYAVAYYYKMVISYYLDIASEGKLNVMTTAYSSDDTLAMLFDSLQSNYSASGQLYDRYAAMINDTAVEEKLDELAAHFTAYGTSMNKTDLLNAYKREVMSYLMGKNAINLKFNEANQLTNISSLASKLKNGAFKTLIDSTLKTIKTSLAEDMTAYDVDYVTALRTLNELFANEVYISNTEATELKAALEDLATRVADYIAKTTEVEDYLYGQLKADDDVTVADLNRITTGVEDLLTGYSVANVKNYVYYTFGAYLQTAYIPTYYYNEDVIALDLAVREMTAAKGAELRALLASDASAYDAYELIIKTMAQDYEAIEEAVSAISDTWTLKMSGTSTMHDLLMKQYAYLMTYELNEYLIGYTADVLPASFVPDAVKTLNSAINLKLDAMMRRVGVQSNGAVDYSLSYQTDVLGEDLDKLASDLFAALADAGYVTEADRAALEPQLIQIFKAAYYKKALSQIGADVGLDLSSVMYEVYIELGEGDSGFYKTSQALQQMANDYVTLLTGLDPEDLIIPEEDESEEVVNKYLSDDGRIVAVTYGSDTNGDGKYEATKTFILNYNKFSVRVNYPQSNGEAAEDSVLYTIPAYGYVVVEYDHGN